MKDNFINESLKLNKKQSPLDKRFNAISLICAFFCVFAWAAFFCILAINFNIGLSYFSIGFYFIAALTLIGLFFSVKELLRNRYFDSLLSFTLLTMSFIAILTTIITQFVALQIIYIFPLMPA